MSQICKIHLLMFDSHETRGPNLHMYHLMQIMVFQSFPNRDVQPYQCWIKLAYQWLLNKQPPARTSCHKVPTHFHIPPPLLLPKFHSKTRLESFKLNTRNILKGYQIQLHHLGLQTLEVVFSSFLPIFISDSEEHLTTTRVVRKPNDATKQERKGTKHVFLRSLRRGRVSYGKDLHKAKKCKFFVNKIKMLIVEK